MSTPDDLRRTSRFVMIAAIATDLAAAAILVITVLNGKDIVGALPLAIPLFVVASALFVVSIGMGKKADEAEG